MRERNSQEDRKERPDTLRLENAVNGQRGIQPMRGKDGVRCVDAASLTTDAEIVDRESRFQDNGQ